MIAKYKRRKSRITPINEVSLTPLIDTALTLLVIFMVATPILHNSIKVDLPKSHLKESKDNKQEVVVTVDKTGQIFVNSILANLNNLPDLINNQLKNSSQKVVFVHADHSISYKAVVDVVDKIKYIAGVEHVVLSTQKA